MKKMILLSAGIVLCMTTARAQEYKAKLTNAKDRKVTIEMSASDVKIEGYNGDEVIIQATSGFEAPPERARGLKPLYNNAVDNSGIGLAVTAEGNGLKIEKATRKTVKYTVRLPRKVAVLFAQTNWEGGADIKISNMDGDLEVRTLNANIDLANVTGPVVANTTSGEVRVVFSTLSQEKPTAISTISGPIDITLPGSTKATMQLRSITGEMYTDFDLGMKAKDGMSKVGGGQTIDGTANGGGVEMQLKTINSNIYIRKQK